MNGGVAVSNNGPTSWVRSKTAYLHTFTDSIYYICRQCKRNHYMDETIFRKKMSNNRKFRCRVEWYLKGQRRCHCCGIQMVWQGQEKNSATVEHLVPESKGGTLHAKNLLVVCKSCNSKRGAIDWVEWVIGNDLPKREWLIRKYEDAINHYLKSTNPKKQKVVHMSVFKKFKQFKELQKAA